MAPIFLATTGHGLARAERNTNDVWVVTLLLAEQDVRCLAQDPLQSEELVEWPVRLSREMSQRSQ